MKELRSSKSLGFRGVAMIATAIGALTIRRLAIRRVLIGSAEFKSLEIQDLTVTRLRAAEITVSDSLQLPGSNVNHQISSGEIWTEASQSCQLVMLRYVDEAAVSAASPLDGLMNPAYLGALFLAAAVLASEWVSFAPPPRF
jgi:hypothetical protein